MKKAVLFLLITSLCLTLCGCWDYEEIKNLTMVSGFGIDYKNDNYLITAEIASMQQEGEQVRDAAKPKIIKGRGKTLFSALQNLNSENGGSLFLKGCSLCIVGKKVADMGLIKIAQFVLNSNELPQTMEFIVSESDAKNIFRCAPQTNQLLCKELADSVANDMQNTATAISCNVCEIYNDEVFITKVENRNKKAKLSGIYYIKNGSIKNNVDLKTTPYVLLTKGVGNTCLLSLSNKGDFYVSSCEKDGKSLNIEGYMLLKEDNKKISKKQIKQKLENRFNSAIKRVFERNKKIEIIVKLKSKNIITKE